MSPRVYIHIGIQKWNNIDLIIEKVNFIKVIDELLHKMKVN